MAVSHLLAAATGAGIALATDRLADRLRGTEPLKTVRQAGSTLAAPTAGLWITDLLNAAYYAKPAEQRDLVDLRLASSIVTTFWYEQGQRRLQARDVLRFHDALGTARLQRSGGHAGTLDTDALITGGNRLFGAWFADAARDPDLQGWGIVFQSVEDKERYVPELRLEPVELGPLAPPQAPMDEQVWQTFPPVEVADAEVAVEALLAVERWPEYTSELGRMTALRRQGLDRQTFEIEVVGFPGPRLPVFLRAYVTVQNLVTAEHEDARDQWLTQLRLGFASRPEPSPVPEGAEVHLAFDLVAHEGHFMGNAKNQLIVYSHDGRSYVRATGIWDPMPWHLGELYDQVGRWNQQAFWGMASPEQSMLHQLAAAVDRQLAAR